METSCVPDTKASTGFTMPVLNVLSEIAVVFLTKICELETVPVLIILMRKQTKGSSDLPRNESEEMTLWVGAEGGGGD